MTPVQTMRPLLVVGFAFFAIVSAVIAYCAAKDKDWPSVAGCVIVFCFAAFDIVLAILVKL